jgi:hypothetical protein
MPAPMPPEPPPSDHYVLLPPTTWQVLRMIAALTRHTPDDDADHPAHGERATPPAPGNAAREPQ